MSLRNLDNPLLKSTFNNDVSVYQLAGTNVSRSLPDWIAKKRKKSLKNDLEYNNRIELIQEFEFSEASNRIKVSADGNFAMATGTYKPQIHVYEFSQAGLKFSRHTDSENVDFLILSEDWTKSVHLQNDRTIEFHTKGGIHYKARIPKFGRCLSYNPSNCDLLVGASGNELYRLNLEQGRFLNPYTLDTDLGINSVDLNPVNGLISAGLEDGTVEFWDSRSRQRVAKLYVNEHLGESLQITSTTFRNDGLNFACGTSNGMSLLYDLRSSTPSVVKDQGYGFEIKKIIWLDENRTNTDMIMTADKRTAKVWDRFDGKPFAAMEPSVDINDVEYIKNSGMFFMANEGMQMHTYLIPELGPAPEWAAQIEKFTEELEEKPSESVYSNYRFISREDLTKLNISHLVGTKILRPFMHGFFIDSDLYTKVNLIANPKSFEDVKKREIQSKIDKERESRIRTTGAVTHTKVKINKDLATRIQQKTGSKMAETVVNDDRFKEMFENPEFAIDEESHEFKQLNPVRSVKDITSDNARALTAAEESDEERMNNMNSDKESDDEESEEESEEEEVDSEDERQQRAKVQKQLDRLKRRKEEEEEERKFMNEMKVLSSESATKTKKSVTFGSQVQKMDRANRVAKQEKNDTRIRKNVRGEAELTFIPKKESKHRPRVNHSDDEEEDDEAKAQKSGRTKQRFDNRRRASKNAFRGM